MQSLDASLDIVIRPLRSWEMHRVIIASVRERRRETDMMMFSRGLGRSLCARADGECFLARGRSLCARAGRHQTPIVDSLWRKRAELKAKREKPAAASGERRSEPKPPEASENSLSYAFSSDTALADTYRNPWGNVRVGRLLEDLDALAGTIAFEHCQVEGEPDLLLVTASVDRIVYQHRPPIDAAAHHCGPTIDAAAEFSSHS